MHKKRRFAALKSPFAAFRPRFELEPMPHVRDEETGLACLIAVARFHGLPVSFAEQMQLGGISKHLPLDELVGKASSLGMDARLVDAKMKDLFRVGAPVILPWGTDQYVVLVAVLGWGRGFRIFKPSTGMETASRELLTKMSRGKAIELRPASDLGVKEERQHVKLRELLGNIVGLRRSLAQVLLLAISMELFTLAAPFYMQWVVDSAIVSADETLLTTLAIGFTLLLLIQITIGWMRSYLVLFIGAHLNRQLVSNLFGHRLRLPVSFFEKRQLGDVVSRFGSVTAIQRALTTKLAEAVIDGIMAVATLIMMWIYSPLMSLVVVVSVGAYAFLRYLAYIPFKLICERQIELQAKEQTLFLESVRAIQVIKTFNHEAKRKERWMNAYVDAANSGILNDKMELRFVTSHKVIAGLENIIVVWLGARLAIDNQLSVGMLFAFLSFKQTFVWRAHALVNKWSDMQMISVQSEHLADIALAPREVIQVEPDSHFESSHEFASYSNDVRYDDKPALSLEVRNVCFRYGSGDPWILRDVNIKIEAGESITLTGPSGCGKTTLVKLMLGLLVPTEGLILVDGHPLLHFGLRKYRSLIGAVMQDDHLLSGTIYQNVNFFEAFSDARRIEACCKAAGLADDISRMPQGYGTFIGDMGSMLSGGQKQRLLLARALYRNPRILFLDEATSHLDVHKESEVNRSVASLKLTRIAVAHRPETIRAAQRVVELSGGRISSDLRRVS